MNRTSRTEVFVLFPVADRRHVVNQYEDQQALSEEEGPQFNNLVVDKNTGRVYIGAVNKLYQLSPNLEPMVSISIESLTIGRFGMRHQK